MWIEGVPKVVESISHLHLWLELDGTGHCCPDINFVIKAKTFGGLNPTAERIIKLIPNGMKSFFSLLNFNNIVKLE